MMTTTLPRKPDRLLLMSFWLTCSLGGGSLVAGGAWVGGSTRWFEVGAIATASLTVLGIAWPALISFAYRAWNRLARDYSRMARSPTIWICYHTLFVIAGRAGSTLELERPLGRSLWVRKQTLPDSAYTSQDRVAARATGGGLWSFVSWATRPAHLWAVCLIPYLFVLQTLTPQEEVDAPTDIYTLY